MKAKVLISAPCYEERCQKGIEVLKDNGCELVINHHGRPYTFEEQKELIGDIDAALKKLS